MFDFNLNNSLGFYDCFFIIEATFNALIKIHKLSIEYFPEEVDLIINKNLIITERIDFNQFRYFLINCEEINTFLSLFNLHSLLKNEINPFNVKNF